MTELEVLEKLLRPKCDPWGRIIDTTTKIDYISFIKSINNTSEVLKLLKKMHLEGKISVEFLNGEPDVINVKNYGESEYISAHNAKELSQL